MERTDIRFKITLLMLAISLAVNVYFISTKEQKHPGNEDSYPVVVQNNVFYSMPDTLSDWSTLQLAIAMTESEFKPDAVGKTKDYGIYQITPIYVEELNRLLGEQVYTHNQAFDISKSVEMFNVMQEFKNPDHDIETAIYYHNKASWYKKKVLRNYETVKRYEELRSILQDYNNPQNI